MHEMLADGYVSGETSRQFMVIVGGDFNNKVELLKAPGVYFGRKQLRPDFEKEVF